MGLAQNRTGLWARSDMTLGKIRYDFEQDPIRLWASMTHLPKVGKVAQASPTEGSLVACLTKEVWQGHLLCTSIEKEVRQDYLVWYLSLVKAYHIPNELARASTKATLSSSCMSLLAEVWMAIGMRACMIDVL